MAAQIQSRQMLVASLGTPMYLAAVSENAETQIQVSLAETHSYAQLAWSSHRGP